MGWGISHGNYFISWIYVNGSQTYMCRVECLQAYCVCRTTDGSVIADCIVAQLGREISQAASVVRDGSNPS